ncbi:U-scoloptoxin(19)-Tl1a-like [Palaemon carinicauda]|uniref:U-scoloptoxin(19)-Tl1a-like n=1 Tax=Palaemon carinicauda TaxID=392227 RepID=UPI0035B654A0
MLVKFSLLVITLILSECRAENGQTIPSDESASETFRQEDPCSRQGGICGLEAYCPPEDRYPDKGLCPTQQDQGVECCGSVPLNVRSCRRRGGECLASEACGRAPRESFGVCPEGQVCCVLLF